MKRTRITAFVLTVIMMVTSVFGNNDMNVKVAKASASVKYEKEKTYNGSGFSVKYVIENQWENQYIANVYITNTGTETIENWELAYESMDEITNIWNANITYHAATNYNIKNAEHNQNIQPGATVSFGFQASFTGSEIKTPDIYRIIGSEMIVNNSDYNVTYNLQSAWNTGCIMEITISNISDENIEDWSMKMDFPYTIQNIWRSKITAHEGNTYCLKNLEYNSIIRPGATETFGMQVAYPENSMVQYPTGIVLSQYKKDKWYLDFDKEWNRAMIHADSDEFVTAANKNKGKIKIAMLDSGIDYTSNINVIEQEDFTNEYDDMSILFSDLSGHGTAVAGILGSSAAADSETFDYGNEYMNKVMNEKIDGVNPYVDLYCARILNDENETTVSKLIKGIEWAIEKT